MKQIPNILTLLRLVLIIPFLVFLYQQKYTFAFYTFFLAGVTDGLDGWLARHFHWQSFFGTFIDPLADKLLVTTSFISLALNGILPWWLVILVFMRDITISLGTVAWYYLIQSKIELDPTYLSKINTTLQLALVTLCLFKLAFFSIPPSVFEVMILCTAITTTATYLDYVWTWGKKACLFKKLSK